MRGEHFLTGRGESGGHQSTSKAQKVKCYHCGEIGHIFGNCPQDQGDEYDAPQLLFKLSHIKCPNCAGWATLPESVRRSRVAAKMATSGASTEGVTEVRVVRAEKLE